MENTDRIKEMLSPGKSVQIEIKNHSGAKLIQKATVQHLDDFNLILSFSDQGNIFDYLKSNMDLALICKHPEEQIDYVFFTKFIRMAGANPPSVLLRTPSEFIKGRQSARFNVTVPFSYFLNHQEIKNGVVHNLSLDGLLATIPTNPDLKVHDRVACKLFIPNSPFPLLLSGTITRIILKPDQKYQIAMHFPYIANDIQDKIVKFLFSAQKKTAFKASELRMGFTNQSASTIRKVGHREGLIGLAEQATNSKLQSKWYS